MKTESCSQSMFRYITVLLLMYNRGIVFIMELSESVIFEKWFPIRNTGHMNQFSNINIEYNHSLSLYLKAESAKYTQNSFQCHFLVILFFLLFLLSYKVFSAPLSPSFLFFYSHPWSPVYSGDLAFFYVPCSLDP